MTWYYDQENKDFHIRLVLENYYQGNVTVFRQACQIFRREFIEIGNKEDFLEYFTIASACNDVLRKRFLKPETIGFIPDGGYICNNNCSKKASVWLLHMEQTDGCQIMHARNWRDYRLPELPKFSVDGYCRSVKWFTNPSVVFIIDIPVSRSEILE